MKTKYLSHAQACAICHDYQFLRGEPFDGSRPIDMVTVAPYSRILQWQFLEAVLHQGRPVGASLIEGNPSGRYNVILVSRQEEEPGFRVKDLRMYLKEAEMPFDESRYACLRHQNIPLVMLRQIFG
jgi:hypothetical protein